MTINLFSISVYIDCTNVPFFEILSRSNRANIVIYLCFLIEMLVI